LIPFALKNFRRAFLLYIIVRLFLTQYISISFDTFFNLQLQSFLDFFFIGSYFIYIIFCKPHDLFGKENFPLKTAFIFCFISILLPSLMPSYTSLAASLYRAVAEILKTYCLVYIFWRNLKTQNDVKFVIKGFFVVFTIAILYGFYERFNGFYNPLIEYEESINTNMDSFSYGTEDRLGLGRVRSIFPHAITCGEDMVIIFLLFYYLFFNRKKFLNVNIFVMVFFFLGLISIVFFTNSRSPLIFFGISMIFMLNFKNGVYLLLLSTITIIFFKGILESYMANIDSIINIFNMEKSDNNVSGSNLLMRLSQLEFVLDIFKDKPLLGHGANATQFWINERTAILGAESIWFFLLIDRGLIGVISFLYLLYSTAKLGIGKSGKVVRAICLGWLVFSTVTSSPGMGIYFIMIVLLITYKIETLCMQETLIEGKQWEK